MDILSLYSGALARISQLVDMYVTILFKPAGLHVQRKFPGLVTGNYGIASYDEDSTEKNVVQTRLIANNVTPFSPFLLLVVQSTEHQNIKQLCPSTNQEDSALMISHLVSYQIRMKKL